MDRKTFVAEVKDHLQNRMIPFWSGLKDEKYGGFYGYMGYDLQLNPQYEKGCILNSRILWFFSNAYQTLKEEALLENAKHAYLFLRDHCLDREQGGVYWSVTYDGKPKDETKHTYNQAFAIYALSSYYDASGDQEALQIAFGLQKAIEDKCTDEYGYLEAFDRYFRPVSNEKLSENGVMAEKTMNTLLHVFEAYTELYRVTHNSFTAERLEFMLELFAEKVYNPERGRQEVFFDRTWNTLIDLYSYGHDIETSWLIDRGLAVLDNPFYTEQLAPITEEIAENIYERAYRDHSVMNEAENGVNDTKRVWWIQAEAIVGFLNAWEKKPGGMEMADHGDEKNAAPDLCVQASENQAPGGQGQAEAGADAEKYLTAAMDIWQYIKDYFVDPREGSEWFENVNEDHTPMELPIVQPWKCPYHNGRMCMEVIRRLGA
ncbi:MAG: AGE family epimerase/isomerase [Lachnospiraceae bacterium]|nr:AGE family epimerase/isomerase [Lachnospiraceae bacterium]